MINLDRLSIPQIPFVTRKESISIEKNEFKDGASEFQLMKNAGNAIANFVKTIDNIKNILIISGGGNNGGDGFIAAGKLSNEFNVSLIVIKKPKTETALKAFETLNNSKLTVTNLYENIDLEFIESKIKDNDVLIDAIYGVGLRSKVKPPFDEILSLFKEYNDKINIISVDLPSGLDCDSGTWFGPEFQPHSIVTMQNMKKGLMELSDEIKIIVSDIGISKESSYIVGPGHLSTFWRRRNPDSHKGINGRVMVIGGSDEFTGAPVLSGRATLRCGVDTLRIAVPETIRDIVAGYNEDFIVVKVRGDRHTTKAFQKFRDLTVQRHDVVAIGMGLSNHPNSVKFVREIFEDIVNDVKVVLDADAIRAFKDNLDKIKGSKAIITPHQAELRMMLGEQVPTNFSERVEFLIEKAKELDIIILFKGRIDIITDGVRILFNCSGHEGMTVGGTGDVLAGVVAAANCFIEDRFFATAIAAYLMGKAGEKAADKYGNSLIASDVIKELPSVLMDHGI